MRQVLSSLFLVLAFQPVSWCDEPAAAAKKKSGDAISPKGQPADAHEGKLTKQPPRYYIWVDKEGWHLRSAAKENIRVKFEGSITLSDGEFGKLRPIGFEAKGKSADRAMVDSTRKKIDFVINTQGSFDGIDFSIAKVKEAQVTFDLKIGGKAQPGRIFIGKEAEHPTEAVFSLPAEGP